MAFFDELSRTLSDKGKEAAQKARDGASVLQMKMQIASEKGKLKELYGAVGAVYYKKHRDDEDTEFGDLFREIGNVLTNVAAMEEKVQQMEGAYVSAEVREDADEYVAGDISIEELMTRTKRRWSTRKKAPAHGA